ncbi:hypothetical protein C9374_012216 [Naegleria lovaniensis]|uniref:Uncharacterized protein n=1 Tax=Naegleria lovaniensis TaxID=51637 RepID=A0AA88G7Q8_NAELO|nr:uncharacterized protein C9374_012216 [Naegleria lovaniensis]KAG2373350.1 hypothetical protein C9374_012216 [Naegleria lovaniensis]
MEAVLKLSNIHAQELLTHRVIRFNKNWDMIPHKVDNNDLDVANDASNGCQQSSTSTSPSQQQSIDTDKPQYVIFLLHPNNDEVPKLSTSDDSSNIDENWFQQEIQQIDQSKEVFDEYFHYLKKHELITSLKAHDHYYERWSQFSINGNSSNNQLSNDSHYCMYMKVLNDGSIPSTDQANASNQYEVGGTLAFSVKNVIVDGQRVKMGLSGSGWLRPKFRPIQEAKLVPWFLQLLMFKELGVRYFYAHVFEDNAKSLGFIEKSGMIPSRFRMNFIGATLPLNPQSSFDNSNSSLQKLNEDQFDSLMRNLYTTGNFLLDNLHDLYHHPNFKGCFVDANQQFTFQIWKCKYATHTKSSENLPAYMVINMTQLNSAEDLTHEQFDRMEQYLQNDLLPQIVQTESHELPPVNVDTSRCSVLYVTNSAPLRTFICERHSQNPQLSYATLAYTFQDNDMFMFYVQSKERQKNTPLPNSEPIWNFMMGESKNSSPSNNSQHLNLFLDPRDCTNKPLVWSEEIRKSVSREQLNKLKNGQQKKTMTASTNNPSSVSNGSETSTGSSSEAKNVVTASPPRQMSETSKVVDTASCTVPMVTSDKPDQPSTSLWSKLSPRSQSNALLRAVSLNSSSTTTTGSHLLRWTLILAPAVLLAAFGVRKWWNSSQNAQTHSQ